MRICMYTFDMYAHVINVHVHITCMHASKKSKLSCCRVILSESSLKHAQTRCTVQKELPVILTGPDGLIIHYATVISTWWEKHTCMQLQKRVLSYQLMIIDHHTVVNCATSYN